eukprot:2036573-Rhodomonas_salina.1
MGRCAWYALYADIASGGTSCFSNRDELLVEFGMPVIQYFNFVKVRPALLASGAGLRASGCECSAPAQ